MTTSNLEIRLSKPRNKYSVVNSGKFVINIGTLWPAEITMIKPKA
jgi:hypothetical protein